MRDALKPYTDLHREIKPDVYWSSLKQISIHLTSKFKGGTYTSLIVHVALISTECAGHPILAIFEYTVALSLERKG